MQLSKPERDYNRRRKLQREQGSYQAPAKDQWFAKLLARETIRQFNHVRTIMREI